jgi:hypothetical protein
MHSKNSKRLVVQAQHHRSGLARCTIAQTIESPLFSIENDATDFKRQTLHRVFTSICTECRPRIFTHVEVKSIKLTSSATHSRISTYEDDPEGFLGSASLKHQQGAAQCYSGTCRRL